MMVVAKARNLNISPRKMRVVANVFKQELAVNAITRLLHINRSASRPLIKVLKSALANAAHVHNLPAEQMLIANITVDEAPALKRFRPVARGTAHSYKKRRSHVTVVLEG